MSDSDFMGRLRTLVGRKREKPSLADPPITIPQGWINAAQAEVGTTVSRKEVEAARQSEADQAVNTVALRNAMLNELSLEELATVAEQVGVAPSQLFGGKGRRVAGVLSSAEKQNRLADLLTACQQAKPDVNWQQSF